MKQVYHHIYKELKTTQQIRGDLVDSSSLELVKKVETLLTSLSCPSILIAIKHLQVRGYIHGPVPHT